MNILKWLLWIPLMFDRYALKKTQRVVDHAATRGLNRFQIERHVFYVSTICSESGLSDVYDKVPLPLILTAVFFGALTLALVSRIEIEAERSFLAHKQARVLPNIMRGMMLSFLIVHAGFFFRDSVFVGVGTLLLIPYTYLWSCVPKPPRRKKQKEKKDVRTWLRDALLTPQPVLAPAPIDRPRSPH